MSHRLAVPRPASVSPRGFIRRGSSYLAPSLAEHTTPEETRQAAPIATVEPSPAVLPDPDTGDAILGAGFSVDVAVMTAFIAVVVTKRHDAPL